VNGSSSQLRKWLAITLMSVMCLGSTVHFLHHVVDRDCDPDGKHGSVPCTSCSVLHGGAITPQTEILAPQAPSVVARLALVDAIVPATYEIVEGTPRAPPA
jgi:hypothetical protein